MCFDFEPLEHTHSKTMSEELRVVVLNETPSKRHLLHPNNDSYRGRAAVTLSEELLSDCVYLFAMHGASLRQDGLVALAEIGADPSYNVLKQRTFALQAVSRAIVWNSLVCGGGFFECFACCSCWFFCCFFSKALSVSRCDLLHNYTRTF